jgi:hypothetical protein
MRTKKNISSLERRSHKKRIGKFENPHVVVRRTKSKDISRFLAKNSSGPSNFVPLDGLSIIIQDGKPFICMNGKPVTKATLKRYTGEVVSLRSKYRKGSDDGGDPGGGARRK